tara:strand:- start:125 stop:328 length:204 start_codon:yes stop_codon:yes gene_type:complete
MKRPEIDGEYVYIFDDEYVEGSVLDLNEEWKPIGLVRKDRRVSQHKVLAFYVIVILLYYFVYITCRG